jgi:hypothetical protein
MSNKMRSIRLQLDKIAEDVKKFDFLPSSVSSTEQANNEMGRETYIGGRDDVQMVGREKEKKHILKLLQNYGDRESSIIPIVGLGGMGKTTIAKFVYTLKETNEFHFDLKAWVYVSMDFRLDKIIGDIISQLDGRIIPVKDVTLHHLKSQLDHILYDKVYLIVLDDLWEERVETNLEERWTTRSSAEEGEFLIPNLHMLFACDCPKLKFLPYPPRSMSWMLGNSNHVLPEHGFGNLSSSTSPLFLVIGDTSLSCEGWRRTQHLSSIEGLQLASITGLRNLPDTIRCFKSLRKLELESCADLETLPEWLGDFTSLREIRIEKCPKLSSLPESTRGLTELKKLWIIDCPELLEKCQGEDKHKIAHIPEVTSK